MAEVKWYGEEFKRDLKNNVIREKLKLCGEIVIEEVHQSMMSPKSGKQGPTSRRSAPGESPAVQTARLKESIGQEPIENVLGVRVGTDVTKLQAVGTNMKLGFWLELGTRGGKIIKPKKGKLLKWKDPETGKWISKREVTQGAIAPRPWLRPALDRSRKAIKTIFGTTK